MNIKQNNPFKLNCHDYYNAINPIWGPNISFVGWFFMDAYNVIGRHEGVKRFIHDLCIPDSDGICDRDFEIIKIIVDIDFDLVYLHTNTNDFLKTVDDLKLRNFYHELTPLELCQNNIMPHAVMTKDNFAHILTKWDQLWDQKPPFILLYQNDQDWYELEPFESQEVMEQFVADHTEKTTS